MVHKNSFIRIIFKALFPGTLTDKKAMPLILVFLATAFMTNKLIAQDTLLTFQKAATIALENNFDIRISNNELSKTEIQDHVGEAGMLPELNLNGSYSQANNSTKQKYSNGDQVDRSNATTENLNAELALGWTIFDGAKMFSTKKRLAAQSNQASISLKLQMEEVYLNVLKSYFEISRQQQLLKSIREEILLGRERLSIANRRFANGSGSKLEVLQAQTDLNSRLSAEMTQLSSLKTSSIDLNRLLARPIETPFSVEDSIAVDLNSSLEQLKDKSKESNSLRSYYRKQLLIAELSLKESAADRWPKIKLNGSYIFNNTENDVGFIRLNKNQGFNYGISASLPLFNGLSLSRNVKTARLDVMNSRLQMEHAEEEVNADLIIAFNKFRDQVAILKLEEQNIVAAREVLLISQERFRAGLSSILELKDVQRTYEEAMSRLVDARYEAKVSEGNVKRLAGTLIQ
jgi:outer membrane protein TolC